MRPLGRGFIGQQHVYGIKEALDLPKVFLGASGAERARVKSRQGGLRQIKFFEGGEVRDQGVAIAEVANDHTGVQQNTFTRSRHQSDPLPPLRRAQSPPPPRQPCNPPWPAASFVALGIEAVDVEGHFQQLGI